LLGASSDERTGLSFKLFLVLGSTVILGSKSRVCNDHNLLSQIRDSSNLEGQASVFIFLRKMGDPVTTPGNCLYFRRILRLASLRWRYSNPPPCGDSLLSLGSFPRIYTHHGLRRTRPTVVLCVYPLLRKLVYRPFPSNAFVRAPKFWF
jgi:hypothetical protein